MTGFCSNHPEKKVLAGGLCGSCYCKWLKGYNPEYARKQKLHDTTWHQENPERTRLLQRMRVLAKHGLTVSDYDTMYKERNGCCDICGVQFLNLVVDHDHTTGKIRGLLCNKHNLGLGNIGDTAEAVRKVLRYLEA